MFERLLAGEGDLKPNDKSALGKLLKRYDRRRVFRDGKRFVVEGKGHKRRFYAVNETETDTWSQGRHGVSPNPEDPIGIEQPKYHADHADHATSLPFRCQWQQSVAPLHRIALESFLIAG